MITRQPDYGPLEIPVDVWDSLSGIRIPGEAMQVLMVIIRRTYGWHQRQTAIPNKEFARVTKIRKQNVVRAIKKLDQMGLIVINMDDNISARYSLNTEMSQWKSSKNSPVCSHS